MIMPNVMVDQLMRDARERGFTTLSGFIRHIIAASPLTSVEDVNDYGPLVWGPPQSSIVKAATQARTRVGTAPHTSQRKLIT